MSRSPELTEEAILQLVREGRTPGATRLENGNYLIFIPPEGIGEYNETKFVGQQIQFYQGERLIGTAETSVVSEDEARIIMTLARQALGSG